MCAQYVCILCVYMCAYHMHATAVCILCECMHIVITMRILNNGQFCVTTTIQQVLCMGCEFGIAYQSFTH